MLSPQWPIRRLLGGTPGSLISTFMSRTRSWVSSSAWASPRRIASKRPCVKSNNAATGPVALKDHRHRRYGSGEKRFRGGLFRCSLLQILFTTRSSTSSRKNSISQLNLNTSCSRLTAPRVPVQAPSQQRISVGAFIAIGTTLVSAAVIYDSKAGKEAKFVSKRRSAFHCPSC